MVAQVLIIDQDNQIYVNMCLLKIIYVKKNLNLLSGFYQNVRGLRTKLFSIQLNMPSLLHFDYFILTETWLTHDISDAELNMADYNIYRLDRNLSNSSHNKGGGVLIAVLRRFGSRSLPITNLSCEHLSVMINVNNTKILLHTCYIPPNSFLEFFKTYCDFIENHYINYPDSILIIVDDFNLPGIHWENSDKHANITGLKTNKSELLEELIVFVQLFQHNFSNNHCSNILDLNFFNNVDLTISKTLFPLVNIDIAYSQLQIIGQSVNFNEYLN